MNLRALLKLIFLIYCLLSISSTQKSSNSGYGALAQETISSDNNLQDLSSQEKSDLKQGKVILKGQQGKYLAQVETRGNIDAAWEVLTDYENFERFLPNITASKVIAENGDRLIFEQVNVVDLWLFQQEFKVQIEAIKTKPTQVDFKIVDGELKKLIGRWQIEEVSPGKILVSHAVEVEPGKDTEKPFFYGVYESSLEETLKAMAIEISQRSQT